MEEGAVGKGQTSYGFKEEKILLEFWVREKSNLCIMGHIILVGSNRF